jgi:hypothetical protein
MVFDFEKEFKKERSEHPDLTDDEVKGLVKDHERLQAAGLDETDNTFRYRVADPGRFDRFRVKDITDGVQITYARVKGSDRWEIQNYIFSKDRFKTPAAVRQWLEKHLKSEISYFSDLKAWNEYRRRCLNAYMHNSKLL